MLLRLTVFLRYTSSNFIVRYQDQNTPAIIMVLGCTKWLGVRLEVLCSLLVTLVATGAVLVTQIPGLIPQFLHD